MIIAEIGLSHDGNIDMAHSYIDVLSNRGIDVIKFQTHKLKRKIQNMKNLGLDLVIKTILGMIIENGHNLRMTNGWN